ncbi:MAG: GNAT family N-acetyltransferase [Anaerolineae bacterium]|nr:GNAT family N-acetyltransferase [Anaerolineae bacterium]
MTITIRPVKTIADCEPIEAITLAAWGAGLESAVPDHLLITLAKNNGVVLLAWDNDRPIGFCFTFPTFAGAHVNSADFRLKHCSHMAAVLPAYQGLGIGERLKWAQRDAVLAQGIDLITWTYDPLESANAYLNLRKLGAVCNTYLRNVYGNLTDTLNNGLATDRFQVDWLLRAPAVSARRNGIYPTPSPDARFVNKVDIVNDLLRPIGVDLSLCGESAEFPCLVAIPGQFQALKKADGGLALAWRDHTRAIFEHAFAAGYTATDFISVAADSAYVLTKTML